MDTLYYVGKYYGQFLCSQILNIKSVFTKFFEKLRQTIFLKGSKAMYKNFEKSQISSIYSISNIFDFPPFLIFCSENCPLKIKIQIYVLITSFFICICGSVPITDMQNPPSLLISLLWMMRSVLYSMGKII